MLAETGRADILSRVCSALLQDDREAARGIVTTEYPFVRIQSVGRVYTEPQMMRIFRRDGFIDRYSGARLVFPGTLRLLSTVMPHEFPFQPNWKMSETHIAYWQLFPTVDHVVPIARGGANDESNWVTTSMLRNAAKSNWTLEELGWTLMPAAPKDAWDGLVGFCRDYLEAHPEHLSNEYIRRWHRAALATSKTS